MKEKETEIVNKISRKINHKTKSNIRKLKKRKLNEDLDFRNSSEWKNKVKAKRKYKVKINVIEQNKFHNSNYFDLDGTPK
mmetsp:Transcript_9984/g.8805  ORF Transcript_9984/g.8805 Transcript_9984/m.8805 type:complete len:80 (-) Transcript_9984:41-280(-)